jgi:hypothetical protein
MTLNDPEYEDNEVLKHLRQLGSPVRDIFNADGHTSTIIVCDVTCLYTWLIKTSLCN